MSFLRGTLRDPTPLRDRVLARKRPERKREDPIEGHPRNTDRRLARAADFNDSGFHVDLAVCVTRVRQGLDARCPGQLPVEWERGRKDGQTDVAELGKQRPPPFPRARARGRSSGSSSPGLLGVLAPAPAWLCQRVSARDPPLSQLQSPVQASGPSAPAAPATPVVPALRGALATRTCRLPAALGSAWAARSSLGWSPQRASVALAR